MERKRVKLAKTETSTKSSAKRDTKKKVPAKHAPKYEESEEHDKDNYLLRYTGEGYGASVFSMLLVSKTELQSLVDRVNQNPDGDVPNENLGGRTSDPFATYAEILTETTATDDPIKINAFKILAGDVNFLGNANIFDFID
jgi:hypothetical protein